MPIETDEPEACSRESLDIIERSTLKTLIPNDSHLDIDNALRKSDGTLHHDSESQLVSIPQRNVLFFDEIVDVYIILQTPCTNRMILKSHLERLTVMIEVQIKSDPSETRDFLPSHEIIFNQSLKGSDNQSFVMEIPEESQETASHNFTYTIWKVPIFLARPRLRLQNPRIILSTRAILKHMEQLTSGDKYLPTHVPSAINMLEAFGDDSSMAGIKPQLSSLRVSRVTPTIQAAMKSSRPLKNTSRQSILVHPVINAKVRYSRMSSTLTNTGLIASVEIDTTLFTDYRVTLTQVELKLNGGIVEDLSSKSGLSLPVVTLPHDNITFLYYLDPEDLDTKSAVRDLFISIAATVDLSNECQPQIIMRWSTTISFTPPVNPGFGTPTLSIKRSHKPTQLSIDYSSVDGRKPNSYPTVNRPRSLTSKSRLQRSVTAELGITVSFNNPTSSIYPGIPFAWTVLIANRSIQPRKLSLTVDSRCRSITTHKTQETSTSQLQFKDLDIAKAIMDEKTIYDEQKASSSKTTEIICLTTEQLIGPLASMACHEMELTFMALYSGILSIEAVRIFDFDTQEHVDIRNLPTINVSPFSNPLEQ